MLNIKDIKIMNAELTKMIERRAELRRLVENQRTVVEGCRKKANLYSYMAQQLADDADAWEDKLDRESGELERMEAELSEVERETYRKGTAEYGTFSEAFDCSKYFEELSKMANSIPFAR